MNNGHHTDLSNEDYHATTAISKSVLDMAAQDVYKPEWARNCPQDQEKIKTFDFGDAMHAICLEPHRLKSEFVAEPEFDRRTKIGKAGAHEFALEHHDKKILTHDEYKQLKLMFESVMAHPQARKLIEAQGIAEGSYFWTDKETGLQCKCRPDKQIGSLLVDVKTTPSLSKFCYSVEDFRYHVQDAWYTDGAEADRMEFLVIQKTIEIGRYPVAVMKLPQEVADYGRTIYREDLNRYAEFLATGAGGETQELFMHHRFNGDLGDIV